MIDNFDFFGSPFKISFADTYNDQFKLTKLIINNFMRVFNRSVSIVIIYRRMYETFDTILRLHDVRHLRKTRPPHSNHVTKSPS